MRPRTQLQVRCGVRLTAEKIPENALTDSSHVSKTCARSLWGPPVNQLCPSRGLSAPAGPFSVGERPHGVGHCNVSWGTARDNGPIPTHENIWRDLGICCEKVAPQNSSVAASWRHGEQYVV